MSKFFTAFLAALFTKSRLIQISNFRFKQSLTRVYIIAFLMLPFSSALAHGPQCGALLGISSLDQLIPVESRISDLQFRINDEIPNQRSLHEELAEIQELFEETISLTDEKNTTQFQSRLAYLLRKLGALEDETNTLILRQTNTDFALAVQNPRIFRPHLLYEIQSMDPHLKRVYFSKDVVEGVLWNREPFMASARRLIFRSLQRGRKYSTESSGIESYMRDRSDFKVRINGEAGALRLAGFFLNEEYYIVAWSYDGGHTDAATNRLINQVNRIRAQMFPNP